jgi:hypothetical protein
MRSSGRSGRRPWWTRWPIQVYQLAPSLSHELLGIALFVASTLLFVAVANPFTLPRVALGALVVILTNGLLVVGVSRLRNTQS